MGIGSMARQPGEPFAHDVDGLLAQFRDQLHAQGHTPRESEAVLNVSELTDEEVEVVQDRAVVAGLGRLVLVDDHRPARPGTTPRALLTPQQQSVLADARAARLLNHQR